MIVSLIVAVADNGVIGRAGGMPWRMSADLKRFRTLTMGKPIIMGRKTFDSLGKPLEGRDNIVVTRQADWTAEGVSVAQDFEVALEIAGEKAVQRQVSEIVVIGGAQLYAAALPFATRIYLSKVHAAPEGDTLFPALDPLVWRQVSSAHVSAGPRDDHDHTFVVLERCEASDGDNLA
jgi:dihydrofolate reductase